MDTSKGGSGNQLRGQVLFDVVSRGLNVWVGLFRPDGTMVTQMQVIHTAKMIYYGPFNHNGVFDLISQSILVQHKLLGARMGTGF